MSFNKRKRRKEMKKSQNIGVNKIGDGEVSTKNMNDIEERINKRFNEIITAHNGLATGFNEIVNNFNAMAANFNGVFIKSAVATRSRTGITPRGDYTPTVSYVVSDMNIAPGSVHADNALVGIISELGINGSFTGTIEIVPGASITTNFDVEHLIPSTTGAWLKECTYVKFFIFGGQIRGVSRSTSALVEDSLTYFTVDNSISINNVAVKLNITEPDYGNVNNGSIFIYAAGTLNRT